MRDDEHIQSCRSAYLAKESKQRRLTMNTSRILKQAWHNVVNYRALWLFGMVLGLFMASIGTAWITLPCPPGVFISCNC